MAHLCLALMLGPELDKLTSSAPLCSTEIEYKIVLSFPASSSVTTLVGLSVTVSVAPFAECYSYLSKCLSFTFLLFPCLVSLGGLNEAVGQGILMCTVLYTTFESCACL